MYVNEDTGAPLLHPGNLISSIMSFSGYISVGVIPFTCHPQSASRVSLLAEETTKSVSLQRLSYLALDLSFVTSVRCGSVDGLRRRQELEEEDGDDGRWDVGGCGDD